MSVAARHNLAHAYRTNDTALAAAESSADINLIGRIPCEIENSVRSASRAMGSNAKTVPERAAERGQVY